MELVEKIDQPNQVKSSFHLIEHDQSLILSVVLIVRFILHFSPFLLGAQLKGRPIRTNWAARKAMPQTSLKQQSKEEIARQSSVYNTTVYVGNLPINCTGKIFRCFLFTKAVSEIAAGHWTLSNHYDQRRWPNVTSTSWVTVSSRCCQSINYVQSNFCKMFDQRKDLKGYNQFSCE